MPAESDKILDMLMSAFYSKNHANYHDKGQNGRIFAPYSLIMMN